MIIDRILIFDVDALGVDDFPARLCDRGCTVTLCGEVGRAVALARREWFAAAVVCLAPGRNGSLLLPRLAATGVPVLAATAAPSVDLLIDALERGASDYLIAPFDVDQLLTRIATARRPGARPVSPSASGLTLDRESGRFGRPSRWVWLTAAEQKITGLLLDNLLRPVTRQQLQAILCDGSERSNGAVDVALHRLRAKLATIGINIRVHRGKGYLLEEVISVS
ncbi:MAG TPA: response regulator transcription factor [Rhodocyclaceae bacterium]|nr:response regulator transcription factor [Rhodocyclaceae bacterium]